MLGDLHGEPAGGSGRPVDEHGLARRELGAIDEGGPRRHAGVGDRRRRHVVEVVGNGQALPGAHGGLLRESAVGRARQQEIDAAPILEPAHAIDAGDERIGAG